MHEYNGEYFVFCEEFSDSGLGSDGFGPSMHGYRFDNNQLVEIVNKHYFGSDYTDYRYKKLELSTDLEQVGIYYDFIDRSGYYYDFYPEYMEGTTSVAESNKADILVSLEQIFNGTHEDLFRFTDEGFEFIGVGKTVDVSIEVNR